MIVTLLSDFGLSDVYVGVMKGAIAQINPQLQIIDLTHQIPPQDIVSARFQLMNAYPYFPAGTVHVAVVDPGVGSQRRLIAVQLKSGYLVAPDNGLISGVLSQFEAIAAVELTNSQYWRSDNLSHTFHGRDIFAPIAAHLASGVPLRELGTEIDLASIVQISLNESVIQAIDHFGNLITNIKSDQIRDRNWSIQIADTLYPGKTTYADAKQGEIIALPGSHGWIEIAANCSSAQSVLNLTIGSPVRLILSDRLN